jgi:hypothetical protein
LKSDDDGYERENPPDLKFHQDLLRRCDVARQSTTGGHRSLRGLPDIGDSLRAVPAYQVNVPGPGPVGLLGVSPGPGGGSVIDSE